MSIATPQQEHALRRANQIRLARAELRRRLRQGQLSAASVIADPPEEARGWEIFAVLSAQRGWRERRARKLLAPKLIPEGKTLAALTERQRQLIISELQARSPHSEHSEP